MQIVDVLTDPYTSTEPVFRDQVAGLSGYRAFANIPLLKDEAVVGFIGIYRREPGAFADNEIALLESFAAQAVIAMENARLLNEQQEALERQSATSEVLQVINASPGNLAPVFDTMLDKAMRLCGVAFGLLYTFEGEQRHVVASRGLPAAFADFTAQAAVKSDITPVLRRVIETKRTLQLDSRESEGYLAGHAFLRALVDLGGARATLLVPLLMNDRVIACFSLYRQEVRAFAEKEIALLENFAAQAVIAMESARLLNELRARTDELAQREDELRVTFENMADGVAMFDATHRLVAWNRNFQHLLDLPDDLLAQRPTFAGYIRTLAARGEYGPDPEAQIARSLATPDTPLLIERTRPNGRTIELRRNPVAGEGFVVITADITERKRNEAEIAAARDAAEQSARAIEAAFQQLKTAQANLIQAEKMASLGQLTAGIAHEIKNPLNFVNNFADLSVELLAELREAIAPALASLGKDASADIEDLTATLTSNLRKITEHGKRADGIVRSMLEHSRGESGDRRTIDINALAEEALNLAYHGARAQDQSFTVKLERDYAENIAPIELNPQDITRVLLNIVSNGFYAANQRARATPDFQPTLKLTTADRGTHVELSIHDNGGGIPPNIREKLFQPFFTTKPPGQGTGLGLSITYDIVTKQHAGSIEVASTPGETTTFTIRLPRRG